MFHFSSRLQRQIPFETVYLRVSAPFHSLPLKGNNTVSENHHLNRGKGELHFSCERKTQKEYITAVP